MPDKVLSRERYGEAFWRKHHEAWQQSALNQREYCEAHGIPLKAFGNWRAKFKSRTAAAGTETHVPTSGPKSYP
jgi:hypothetical protein